MRDSLAPNRSQLIESDGRLAAPSGLTIRVWDCPKCRYHLSGLPPAGLCPECGEAYEADCLHVRGWRHMSSVPLAARSRARLLIFSLATAFFLALIGHAAMNRPVGRVSMVVSALALFPFIVVVGVMRDRWLLRASPRSTHALLAPTHLDVTGVWRNARVPWDRFTRVAVTRRAPGLYRLVLDGSPWRTFFRECLPWEAGLWRVVIVFRGTSRDAALVRRVCRERVVIASTEPRLPRC